MAERFNIISETYHYLSGVADVEDLPVDLPGVESVSIMSGTSSNKSSFKGVRLQYKKRGSDEDLLEGESLPSVPDKIGPRAIYCFDEFGSDDMMFMNNTLLEETGRRPEPGERITAASFGFFLTILTTLHGQYPKLFADPKPLVEKMVGPLIK